MLKIEMTASPRAAGYEIDNHGVFRLSNDDVRRHFIIPLVRAVAIGRIEHAVSLCGSGVGASVAANKIPCVSAGLIHDVFSVSGVEDDDLNMLYLGGRVLESTRAAELSDISPRAHFSYAARRRHRLARAGAETGNNQPCQP